MSAKPRRTNGHTRVNGHGRVVRSRFQPHPLLRNPHLQTVVPEVLRSPPRVPLERERVELPDGDFVDLGWAGSGPGPIAVLVHGIIGGMSSGYVRSLADELVREGWIAVILQLRGAGDEPNRLARFYHHGDTADFRHVCRLLRKRQPDVPIFAVGWSLGASVVLKAAGEEGAASPLAGIAAISAPFCLRTSGEQLRSGSARVYQAIMLRELKRAILRKHQVVAVPGSADLAAALAARDFFEFGDAYMAPVNGFRDVGDFCKRAACGRFMRRIRRPTLVLQARDDPFLGKAVMLPAESLAPQVTVEMAAHGGHVGFVAAGPWGRPVFWAERRVRRFLRQRLAQSA
jgi:uncharacterized protein